MGFIANFFRRPIGGPHLLHPDDESLVISRDIEWFSNLSDRDIISLNKQDDFFKVVAYEKYKDEGFAEKDAARQVWKCFPYFYINPENRTSKQLEFDGDDSMLPFLIKDKVNRLAQSGALTENHVNRYTTMNAAIRSLIRNSG